MPADLADNARGLPVEVVEGLLEAAYTTQPEGMGIGLPICRSIIEFHQGHLWVEARHEGGTVFRFTVPIEEIDDE